MEKKIISYFIFFKIIFITLNCIDSYDKNHYYNEIYGLLTTEYKYFIKKMNYPEESIFNLLLSQNPSDLNASRKKIFYKNSIDLFNIVNIIKIVFENARQKGISDDIYNLYIAFIVNLEKSLKADKNILFAFKHALYNATGNDKFFLKLLGSLDHQLEEFNKNAFNNSNNIFIIGICWILYAYDKFYLHFDDLEKSNMIISTDALFVFSYPFYIDSINKIYEKIRFDDTLKKCFGQFIRTNEGLRYIFNTEKYPKFINSDMASIMINNRKNLLLKLLSSSDNEKEINEIELTLNEVARYSKLMYSILRGVKSNNLLYKIFLVDDGSVEGYLKDYIPINWGVGLNGVQSSKMVYGLSSMLKFYEQSFAFFFDKAEVTKKFFLLESMPSFRDYYKNQKIISERQKYQVWKSSPGWKWDNNKFQYENMPGLSGQIINAIPYLTPVVAGGSYIISSAFTIWKAFGTARSLLTQFKGISNYYLYFSYLKKMIFYSNKLLSQLNKLYTKNNCLRENMIPEMIEIQKMFNKKKNGILKKIYDLSSSKIKFIGNTITNFFIPGLMSHFYFRELYESREIDTLEAFIGAVDFAFSKKKLIGLKNDYPDLIFDVPTVISYRESPSIILDIEDMWLPNLRGKPIKNSLKLDENARNMMIVGPVASGKTVFLSTILSVIYMSYMGIAPAAKSYFSYFDNIFGHMEHTYEIGSGTSQHLAERASMRAVKKVANELPSSQKAIMIIDEIYKGTIPKLAVREAAIDLPPILMKNNIITIVTTHFPEITEITRIYEYSMKLYYLLVNYNNGNFVRMHKLRLDDEKNWWLNNEDLALKYQLYLDKK